MQMNSSAEDTRPSYIAVFSCVTALAGTALGSLFAGTLLKAFAASGLFTGWFDRYKMLFVIATALRVGAVFLLIPGIENDRPVTIRQTVAKLVRYR